MDEFNEFIESVFDMSLIKKKNFLYMENSAESLLPEKKFTMDNFETALMERVAGLRDVHEISFYEKQVNLKRRFRLAYCYESFCRLKNCKRSNINKETLIAVEGILISWAFNLLSEAELFNYFNNHDESFSDDRECFLINYISKLNEKVNVSEHFVSFVEGIFKVADENYPSNDAFVKSVVSFVFDSVLRYRSILFEGGVNNSMRPSYVILSGISTSDGLNLFDKLLPIFIVMFKFKSFCEEVRKSRYFSFSIRFAQEPEMREKMPQLAHFICQMQTSNIFALLISLCGLRDNHRLPVFDTNTYDRMLMVSDQYESFSSFQSLYPDCQHVVEYSQLHIVQPCMSKLVALSKRFLAHSGCRYAFFGVFSYFLQFNKQRRKLQFTNPSFVLSNNYAFSDFFFSCSMFNLFSHLFMPMIEKMNDRISPFFTFFNLSFHSDVHYIDREFNLSNSTFTVVGDGSQELLYGVSGDREKFEQIEPIMKKILEKFSYEPNNHHKSQLGVFLPNLIYCYLNHDIFREQLKKIFYTNTDDVTENVTLLLTKPVDEARFGQVNDNNQTQVFHLFNMLFYYTLESFSTMVSPFIRTFKYLNDKNRKNVHNVYNLSGASSDDEIDDEENFNANKALLTGIRYESWLTHLFDGTFCSNVVNMIYAFFKIILQTSEFKKKDNAFVCVPSVFIYTLPEIYLVDMLNMLKLLINKKITDDISLFHKQFAMILSGLVMFLAGDSKDICINRKSRFVKNPHHRGKIVETMSAVVYAFDSLLGDHSEQFFGLPYKDMDRLLSLPLLDGSKTNLNVVEEFLAENVIDIFIDIEFTGESTAFHEKFRYRHSLYVLIKDIWRCKYLQNVIISKFEQLLSVKDGDSSKLLQENPLLKFINLLTNDAIYLLDESIMELNKIRQYEELISIRIGDFKSLSEEVRKEKSEEYKKGRDRVKSLNILSLETVEMVKYLSKKIKGVFLCDVMVDKVTSMLNYLCVQLVSKQQTKLKVMNPVSINFDPKKLLLNVSKIYVTMEEEERFLVSISKDERSYSNEMFVALGNTLQMIQANFELIKKVKRVGEKVFKIYNEMKDEPADYSDAPDEFFDILTAELMDEPVTLRTSNVVVDLKTITRHLLSSDVDPFNRAKITNDDIVANVELKRRIEEYKRGKKK